MTKYLNKMDKQLLKELKIESRIEFSLSLPTIGGFISRVLVTQVVCNCLISIFANFLFDASTIRIASSTIQDQKLLSTVYEDFLHFHLISFLDLYL